MHFIWPPRAGCTSSRQSLDLNALSGRLRGPERDSWARAAGANELRGMKSRRRADAATGSLTTVSTKPGEGQGEHPTPSQPRWGRLPPAARGEAEGE